MNGLDLVYLLREDYSSIQKGGNQVVNLQMNLGSIVLLKVVIHLQPLDYTTGQHPVGLPPLIILRQETQPVKMTGQQTSMVRIYRIDV